MFDLQWSGRQIAARKRSLTAARRKGRGLEGAGCARRLLRMPQTVRNAARICFLAALLAGSKPPHAPITSAKAIPVSMIA